MDTTLAGVTIDCRNCHDLATFWHSVLGWEVAYDAADGAYLSNPDGPGLFLQPVPEEKVVKNRVHLDLRTTSYAADLATLQEVGALLLREDAGPDGRPYAVLTDPEGSEFCLVSATA